MRAESLKGFESVPVLVALYQPTDQMVTRLARLSESVSLYVFDNSIRAHRENLTLATYEHCPHNAGIVGALGWMLSISRERGVSAFVFFDQDTIFDAGTVRHLSEDFISFGCTAALVHYSSEPQVREKVRFVINSGSLFRVDELLAVWGDVQSYFVDAVDLAICASIRRNGGSLLSRWAPGIDHLSDQGFRRVRLFGAVRSVKAYPKTRRAEFYRGHSRLLCFLLRNRRIADFFAVAKFVASFGVGQAWADILVKVGRGVA
jgi:hypothetical protein